MDKILFSNSFKNLMFALGAKTSDSGYAVPLINKTSGAPQGYMEMSALAQVLGEATFLTYDNVPENPTNELNDIRGIKVINWNSISPYKGTSLILSFNGSFLPGFYERGVQIRFYNQNIASNPTTVKYRVRWGNSGWGEWSDI